MAGDDQAAAFEKIGDVGGKEELKLGGGGGVKGISIKMLSKPY